LRTTRTARARCAEDACTPDSVKASEEAVVVISLGPASRPTSLRRCSFRRAGDPTTSVILSLSKDERSCSRWGLPAPTSPWSAVRSYRTISPLPRPCQA